jgi:hypothetical protein
MFNAYRESANGLNVRGNPIPTWDALPEHVRGHWKHAARAAINELGAEYLASVVDTTERLTS